MVSSSNSDSVRRSTRSRPAAIQNRKPSNNSIISKETDVKKLTSASKLLGATVKEIQSMNATDQKSSTTAAKTTKSIKLVEIRYCHSLAKAYHAVYNEDFHTLLDIYESDKFIRKKKMNHLESPSKN